MKHTIHSTSLKRNEVKKVINIFGGPGTGKSTLAASLFAEMKKSGYNVELITEYAKQMVFEERMNVLTEDQLYVFAKQHRKILTLKNTVEYVITDSPFIQGIVYLNASIYNALQFENLVLITFNSYPNLNIYLNRSGLIPYEEMGRYQDEDGAKALDHKIYYAMGDLGIKFDCLEAGINGNEIRIMDLL